MIKLWPGFPCFLTVPLREGKCDETGRFAVVSDAQKYRNNALTRLKIVTSM